MTATTRKVAVLFYNAVRHGMDYVDPGASSYETRYRTRVVNNLHRRAKAFGFGAVVCSWSLLIRRPCVPAVRQKLHLSPCADFRGRLCVQAFF